MLPDSAEFEKKGEMRRVGEGDVAHCVEEFVRCLSRVQENSGAGLLHNHVNENENRPWRRQEDYGERCDHKKKKYLSPLSPISRTTKECRSGALYTTELVDTLERRLCDKRSSDVYTNVKASMTDSFPKASCYATKHLK